MSTSTDRPPRQESVARLTHVAILYHPLRPQALAEARWLQRELEVRGVKTGLADGWHAETVRHICEDQDLVVAFGGDGTIIRVAHFAAPVRVPVLGVNLGRVGFLCDMTPGMLHTQVDVLVSGSFWLEHRCMLDVTWSNGDTTDEYRALNEVTVARGAAPRAISVETRLDGAELTRYTADGVLVATATGSTAYSLAAGGPVLFPESLDFMVTPVAPHLHIGRSVIVPGSSTVDLRVTSDRPAVMSVDGQDERALHPTDIVTVRRSDLRATFARFGPREYFYAALAARLR